MPGKKLLILDFDNTLFDWVTLWHRCFVAMMDEVAVLTGMPLEDLQEQIRTIHRTHGTSEYAFLLEEVPSLGPFRTANLLKRYSALRSKRSDASVGTH